MKPHFIDSFINSAIKIIKKTTGVDSQKKNVYMKDGKVSLGGVGVILTVSGDIGGVVAYEFSREITMALASKMIKRSAVSVLDKNEFLKLLKSAIKELGNLISGKAITTLMDDGFDCKISPPKIYLGQGVQLIPDGLVAFVIEMETKYGEFVINLAIQKEKHFSNQEKKAMAL